MDSAAQTVLVASEIMNEIASTGDTWIRQHKHSHWPQK
jgi:hypothetical protein